MAECWRRGLTGRVLADREPAAAGPIAPGGVLRSMMRHARRVFDHAIAEAPAEAPDRADLARHRAVCLAVLEPAADRARPADAA
jgi:hypothetical protein